MIVCSRLVVAVVAVIVISNSGSGRRGTNLSFLKKNSLIFRFYIRYNTSRSPKISTVSTSLIVDFWVTFFFSDILGKFIRHFRATFHSTHSNGPLIIPIKAKVE